MYRKAISVLVLSSVYLATGVAAGGTKATQPNPANGALNVAMPLLQWIKGDKALLHDVYLGLTPELTAENLVATHQASALYYHLAGFQPGTTYYWRVDEIASDGVTTYKGDVWHFMTQALTAYYPSPADGGTAPPETTLSWLPGASAVTHHLYLGASRDAVAQGAADVDKGSLSETTFTPGDLQEQTTYYWRVDEVLTDGTVRTGPVWSFLTFLPVEDFESYTDEADQEIFSTWIDGVSDGSSGSTVGYWEAPFAEQMIVHDGNQSMPMEYNNVDAPFYSEAERTFAPTLDWTAPGLTTLTLYFRGLTSNTPDKLYVAVQDKSGKIGVATYPATAPLTLAAWTRWEIPLSDFSAAGVNLAAVKAMSFGVGDRDQPTAGGTGTVYIDDVSVGGVGEPLLKATLFAEDFEGLALGPNVKESVQGKAVWTKTAPPGWVHDDQGVPGVGTAQDGVTEWAGWSFADRLWWTTAAEDQNRSQFTKGTGTVAIADPDEWDDQTHPDSAAAGWYNTYLSTPPIDISAAQPGTLELTFDSSWRPEYDDNYHQTANVTVSFDGGPAQELFRWESNTASPNYKADATNETVKFLLDSPAGAKTMVLTFGLFDAGNDWWWAVDNILVTAATN